MYRAWVLVSIRWGVYMVVGLFKFYRVHRVCVCIMGFRVYRV